MHKYLVRSLVLTCTSLTLSAQNGLAQSPPAQEQDVLIWSDRDMSLRSGGDASTMETEKSLHLPHIHFRGGYSEREKSLVCEPGQLVFIESGAAAYAQAGQQPQKAR